MTLLPSALAFVAAFVLAYSEKKGSEQKTTGKPADACQERHKTLTDTNNSKCTRHH